MPAAERLSPAAETRLVASNRVSFNLYRLRDQPALRPCEMPVPKVVAFVLGYRPYAATTSP